MIGDYEKCKTIGKPLGTGLKLQQCANAVNADKICGDEFEHDAVTGRCGCMVGSETCKEKIRDDAVSRFKILGPHNTTRAAPPRGIDARDTALPTRT